MKAWYWERWVMLAFIAVTVSWGLFLAWIIAGAAAR